MAIMYTCPCGRKTIVTTGKVIGERLRCPSCQRLLFVTLPKEKRVPTLSALEYAGLVCPHCGEATTYVAGRCQRCGKALFDNEEVIEAEVKVESEPPTRALPAGRVMRLFFKEPGRTMERLPEYLGSFGSGASLAGLYILSLIAVATIGAIWSSDLLKSLSSPSRELCGAAITVAVSLAGILVASVLFTFFVFRQDTYRGFLPLLLGVVFVAAVINFFLWIPVVLRLLLYPVGETIPLQMMWLAVAFIYALKVGLYSFMLNRTHRVLFASVAAFAAVLGEVATLAIIVIFIRAVEVGGMYTSAWKLFGDVFR